jgi:aspartate kinase
VSGADVLVAEETIRDTFPGVPLQKRTDVAKVSIVGVGMRTHAGVAARLFKALASKAIDVLLVTTSEIKVACLIERSRAVEAVQALHAEFIDAP